MIYLLLCSVALTSLAFPAEKIWLGILGWVCFAPIIYLNEKLPIKQAFVFNCLFFYLIFIALFWLNPFVETQRFINQRDILVTLAFLVLFPLMCAVIFTFIKVVAQKFSFVWRLFIYAALWVSFEYILTLIPNFLPLSMALSQAKQPYFLQLVPFMGIYIVSFLLLVVNTLLALAFCERRKELIIVALLIVALNFVFGATKMFVAPSVKTNFKIGLVQSNVSWSRAAYDSVGFFKRLSLNQLYRVSKRIKADLIVWPELAANGFLLQDKSEPLANFARKLKTPLLVGTHYYYHQTKGFTNIAALISQTGNTIGVYEKQKLFPFSESAGYQPGQRSNPLGLKQGDIGPLICFESLYPQIAQRLTKQGANLLVLLGNSAWFGKTRWPWLHQSYMVFRALETGRYAVHLNNTGPSVVISPLGLAGKELPAFEKTVARADVRMLTEQTFYTKSNELFPKVVFVMSCLIVLGSIFCGRRWQSARG